jgi:hypothetical protein
MVRHRKSRKTSRKKMEVIKLRKRKGAKENENIKFKKGGLHKSLKFSGTFTKAEMARLDKKKIGQKFTFKGNKFVMTDKLKDQVTLAKTMMSWNKKSRKKRSKKKSRKKKSRKPKRKSRKMRSKKKSRKKKSRKYRAKTTKQSPLCAPKRHKKRRKYEKQTLSKIKDKKDFQERTKKVLEWMYSTNQYDAWATGLPWTLKELMDKYAQDVLDLMDTKKLSMTIAIKKAVPIYR